MTIPDGLGEALRAAMAVPTDTMITLDLPLLLTKLAQVPARDATVAAAAAAASASASASADEPQPAIPRQRVAPLASTDDDIAP